MNVKYRPVEVADSPYHFWLREDFEAMMPVLLADTGGKAAAVSLTYPGSTKDATEELKLRGLRTVPCQLFQLVADGFVNPARLPGGANMPVGRPDSKCGKEAAARPNLAWDRADVDAAADWLYKRRYWDRWTDFCWMANLRFGQVIEAYRAFCAADGKGFQLGLDVLGSPAARAHWTFGRPVRPAGDGSERFVQAEAAPVMVIEPSPAGEGYARVRFFPAGTKLSQVE